MAADPLAETGMGTTPGMWEMVSKALDSVGLPYPINKVIHALCEGTAQVVPMDQSTGRK